MKIINKTKNTVLAENAIIADTPFTRSRGLLGRKELQPKEALVITCCNSIHTFFMRFSIDVLFVDAGNKIVGIKNGLKPWRLSPIYWRAPFAIELPSGAIRESLSSIGDEVSLTLPFQGRDAVSS